MEPSASSSACKTYVRGRFVVTEGGSPALPVLSEACSYQSSCQADAACPSSLRKTARGHPLSVRFSDDVEVNLLTRSHSFHSYEKLKDNSSAAAAAPPAPGCHRGGGAPAAQPLPHGAGLKRSRSLPANCTSAAVAAVAAAVAAQQAAAPRLLREVPPSPFTCPESAKMLAACLQAAPASGSGSSGRMYQRGRFVIQEAAAPPRPRARAAPAVLAAAAEVAAALEQQLQPSGSASSVSSSGSCGSVVNVVKRGRFLVHTTSLKVGPI
jgi:hypothetical protein